MLYWLDGRDNRKGTPQENFGRELMELFTFGVEHYVETDVYAAARVFTGWNLVQTGTRGTPTAQLRVQLHPGAARHRTRKTSAFRSTRTAARGFPSAARPRACRTASI